MTTSRRGRAHSRDPATSLHSPKVNGVPGIPKWYGYYAGYSPAFVRDVVNTFALPRGATILDPWNGAGTTTDVGASMGYRAVGLDLNPALVLVARARHLDASMIDDPRRLAKHVLIAARRLEVLDGDEPLAAWMTPSAAAAVRGVERSIRRLALDSQAPTTSSPFMTPIEEVEGVAALYYVALFETIRTLLARFRTTNPAWIKTPASARLRVRPSTETIYAGFRHAVDGLATQLSAKATSTHGHAAVSQGDSAAVPLPDGSVDAVICSPPYCTRIDYVMTTLPELALLGYSPAGPEVRELRSKMLGTPTISRAEVRAPLPRPVRRLISAISAHPSQASAGYYRKYFEQYFTQLLASLSELRRVVRPGGKCGLVVQDSYYKDVHVDLPRLTSQLAEAVGFCVAARHDFTVPNTKAAMNPRTRQYRQSFGSTESLIVLERA